MVSKPKPHYKNQQKKKLHHKPHLCKRYAMEVNRGTTLTVKVRAQ